MLACEREVPDRRTLYESSSAPSASFFRLLARLLVPPPSMLQKALEPKQAPWMAPVQQFWDLVGSVEGTLAAFGIFALFAAYTRYQPRALLFAFFAGMYLANVLFR